VAEAVTRRGEPWAAGGRWRFAAVLLLRLEIGEPVCAERRSAIQTIFPSRRRRMPHLKLGDSISRALRRTPRPARASCVSRRELRSARVKEIVRARRAPARRWWPARKPPRIAAASSRYPDRHAQQPAPGSRMRGDVSAAGGGDSRVSAARRGRADGVGPKHAGRRVGPTRSPTSWPRPSRAGSSPPRSYRRRPRGPSRAGAGHGKTVVEAYSSAPRTARTR